MISCAKCGVFISHDSSNLSFICDACVGSIKELEAERLKLKKQPCFGYVEDK